MNDEVTWSYNRQRPSLPIGRMKMRGLKGILLMFCMSITCVWANNVSALECDSSCSALVFSENKGQIISLNPERAKRRYPPYSTFKIANTLVAIEVGLVDSLEKKLSYDTARYPKQSWWPAIWFQQPLPIRDAFQSSALPIYQQLAYQIGEQKMSEYLSLFRYGNQDITSGIDSFWLNGSLKISAAEQIAFLQRIFRQEIGLDETTYRNIRHIMKVERTDTYTLYAKTGGGGIGVNEALGWYVGVVEQPADRFYFAVNVSRDSFAKVLKPRITLARQVLIEAGALPIPQ